MLSRREFIKRLLKISAAIGISPVLPYTALARYAPEEKGVKKYVTGCMWCQNGCSMIVYIKDNKAIYVTGNPDDPVTKGRICIKPLGSIELLNSPYRLRYPLKRIGGRGDNARFIKMEWDQILDEIAEKLKEIKKRYGGEALGIWASGRSAADGRYLNKAFAKLYGTPNYEKTGPFCNYAGKVAGILTVGTGNSPWIYAEDDFFGAELYILVGSNMAITRPVAFKRIMERKALKKCKIITVDPRFSETAEKSDLWLPIRPGTDMALALSMISYIIRNGLEDKEFIQKYTVGYEKLREEILRRNYSLSWAEKVTGINREKIEWLSTLYARTKKAIIVGNSGISHHTNSVNTHRAFYILAAITGHFGEKATGYCCLNNGSISIGKIEIPKHRIPKTRPELSKNPVGWLESLDNPAYPYKLRALICTGSPLTQWPDQNRIRRYISMLDLSVYNELTMNINAYYFDYILPAATWIEAGGVAPVSDDSRFVWVPKLVDPPGLAKPDKWWWIELGKRMGWGDIFRDELKDPVFLQNEAGKKKGFTVDRFLKKADLSLRAPIRIRNGKVEERGTLFLNKKFFTKSKKIEIWTKSLEEKLRLFGLSAIPDYFQDPDIAERKEKTILHDFSSLLLSPFQKFHTLTFRIRIKEREKEEDFPFYLITGRPSSGIMGHTSHWIRKLNDTCPDQFCLIHKEVAKRLGIREGERIVIYSPYGEIEAIAKITDRIRKDTVFIPYSFGEKSPFTSWPTVNFLTNMRARCPISGEIAFKGIKVNIRKI